MGIPSCFPKGRGGHPLGQAPEGRGRGHPILWRGGRVMPQRLCLGSITVQCLPSQGLIPGPHPRAKCSGTEGSQTPPEESWDQRPRAGEGDRAGILRSRSQPWHLWPGCGSSCAQGRLGRFGVPSTSTSHALWSARPGPTYLEEAARLLGAQGPTRYRTWTWSRMAGGTQPRD